MEPQRPRARKQPPAEVSLAPLQPRRQRRILAQLAAACLAQQRLLSQLKHLVQLVVVFLEASLRRQRQREREEACLAIPRPLSSRQPLVEVCLEAPLRPSPAPQPVVVFLEANPRRRQREQEEVCSAALRPLSSQEVASLVREQLQQQPPPQEVVSCTQSYIRFEGFSRPMLTKNAVEQLQLSQHSRQTKLPPSRSTMTICDHDRDSMTLLSRSRTKLLSSTKASSASSR